MRNVLFKWILVAAMVGLLCLPGCKESEGTAYHELYRLWEWVESTGGFAGGLQTPDSVGYNQYIEFEEDGRYTHRKEGIAVTRGTYTIISAESILDNQVYDMLVFDNGAIPNQAIIQLTDNRLVLRDECFDCSTHIYSR